MVHKQLLEEKISVLSPLEQRVCSVLWCSCAPCVCGPSCECGVKVRDVFQRLKTRGVRTTPSSVAVTLDRLHSLGLLKRREARGLGGAHYFYSLKMSRQQFERALLDKAVDNLVKAFGPGAKAHLAERFSRGGRVG